MRLLRVVGLSDDGAFVHLAGERADDGEPGRSAAVRATFRVAVDDALRAAVRGEDPSSAPEPSALTPREIQARLRAGETVEQVARAARVPVRRVERYAGPVESERAQVVAAARAAAMLRPRGGAAARPLGELVDAALEGSRSTPDWSARRSADGSWLVSVGWTARGAARRAEWTWRPAERELTPAGPLAARLGWEAPVSPARPRKAARRTAPPPAAPSPTPPRTANAGATRSGATKAGATRSGAAKAGAARTAAARTGTAKPGARTGAAKTSAAGAPRAGRGAAAGTPRTSSGADAGAVPSWEDVLLGTATPRRPARGRGAR